ncbi:MAG: DUF2807 domain-containing protein [Bacteroidetes bacterium]|nr:DUF2807 domain-containing protein [Bacteroidota bacterium]
MRKILSIAVLAIVITTSCNKEVLRGSGSIITEERSIGSFNAISTFGSAKIFISYSPEITVKVKGYQNLVSEYETKVSGNTLSLKYRDNVNIKNDNIEVYITMPGFIGLNSNGSTTITASGNYDDADNLNIDVSGSATISIDQMKVNNYSIHSDGSSEISSKGVLANSAKVHLNGSGSVILSVQNSLDVYISGSGKVSYKGEPANITTDISGSGSLIKL